MFDYLIQNVRLLDGSGRPALSGDAALSGGRIAAAGALAGTEAAHVIDGHGRFLTPGFIDIHRHADAALFRSDFGRAELAQGLTTILNGNCGLSLAPVSGPHRKAVLDYLTPIVGEAGEDFSSLADYRRRANVQATVSTKAQQTKPEG